MITLAFAEENPDAAVWFALLYQAFATANPGRRGIAQMTLERHILERLDALSTPGPMQPTGFTPRTLREPCIVAFTPEERELLVAYLSAAAFPPFLSAPLLDLLAALTQAPETGSE